MAEIDTLSKKYDDPPAHIIRDYISQQICWICGKGGWKALSQHLVKKHGLPAKEVREIAYMFKTERLISDELSLLMSKDALRRFGDKRYVITKGSHMHKELSTKAKRLLRKRIREIAPQGNMPEELKQKLSQIQRQAFLNGRIPWNKLAKQKRIHEQRSRQAKEFWEKFKELPIEQQREWTSQRAASRRKRVIKVCVICGQEYEIIPSHANESVTCGNYECKTKNMRIKGMARKHTVESLAKMSAYAKERHRLEGPLFGRRMATYQPL